MKPNRLLPFLPAPSPLRLCGRFSCFLALLLILLSFLPACARRESPVEIGNREQILHRGNLSEPQDLDPHVVTGVTEFNIMSALLEGLVNEDPRTLAPVPGVASSWTISDDQLRYTFQLRPDARWSNNDPVTADDFVFSYQRMLSPKFAAPYAYMLFVLEGAEAFHRGDTTNFATVGVKAIDPHTLELTLKSPVPYLLSMLNHHSWFPVHPPTIRKFNAVEDSGTAWTKAGNFVGNGAFSLVTWEPNSKIVVRKNDTYWDRDRVKLHEIHFYPIGDNNIEERAFRAGQLHVTGTVPIDRIAAYQKENPNLLRLDPYLGTYFYLFNVTRPPLTDVRVRRALSMAIDRERLVRRVTLGGEAPAYNFTPPDTAGYTARASFTADPDAARKLLADAGFPGGQGFPHMELLYNNSEAHARIAQAIQQMWKETLGIDIQLVSREWKVYVAEETEKRYDIGRMGWVGDYVDPNSFLDIWVTDGGNNRSGWSNAEYDRLIAEAARATNNTERYEHFQRAEELLIQEMPITPLYFYKSKALVSPSVHGWYPNILDHHPYNDVVLEPAK